MSKTDKLDILNIIEIQQIKTILKNNNMLNDVFNLLLKIANKQLKNDKLEEIANDTDSDFSSIDLASDSSDDNIFYIQTL